MHVLPTLTRLRLATVLAGLLLSSTAYAADETGKEKGSLGFAVKVAVAGLFDHTLKSVVVQAVDPGLPAAAAGLAPGDTVLEVEGKPVPGSKAGDMAALVKRKVGESVTLKLQRANGEVYAATLVAAPAPKPR
jgi:C-terminal processing protease CtpA/Prc